MKGLCRACAAELEGGLACRTRCEEHVAAIVAMVRQSARFQGVSTGLLRSARGLWLGLTLVAASVGVFVALWGLSLPTFREVSLLALPFFALAVLSGRLARSVRSAPDAGPGAGGSPSA